MKKTNHGFYNDIAQNVVMSDGMLPKISYTDYALLIAAKDKPQETRKEHKH